MCSGMRVGKFGVVVGSFFTTAAMSSGVPSATCVSALSETSNCVPAASGSFSRMGSFGRSVL